MEPIKKILVGLDMTEMDNSLLEYTNFLVKSTEAEEIHFMNVIKEFHLPAQVLKDFPDLEKKALTERKQKLEQSVNEKFDPDHEVNIYIDNISSSSALKSFLKKIASADIDLVLLGRKSLEKGSGVLIQRLARRATCHLLIVPENSVYRIKGSNETKKLLVPTDFSMHSKNALERAIIIAAETAIEIFCQYVYSVPSGYHYSGKSKEEFAQIMHENAEVDYEYFIQSIDTKGVKITPVFSENIDEDITSEIGKQAKSIDADGIVFSSKGRTATAALFLGSIAEKLIKNELDFPLLVVRTKGEHVGLLDIIKKM